MASMDNGIRITRDYIGSRVPKDPHQDYLAIQDQLDNKQHWQDALNSRILQLAGKHETGPILMTWQGSRDPRLVARSI